MTATDKKRFPTRPLLGIIRTSSTDGVALEGELPRRNFEKYLVKQHICASDDTDATSIAKGALYDELRKNYEHLIPSQTEEVSYDQGKIRHIIP